MRPYADRHLWRTEATTIRDVWSNLESIWTENSVISPYWVAWSMTLWVEPVSQRLGIEFLKSTLQFGLGNWIVSTQRRVLDPDRWPVTWRCGMDALACVVTFGGCFFCLLVVGQGFRRLSHFRWLRVCTQASLMTNIPNFSMICTVSVLMHDPPKSCCLTRLWADSPKSGIRNFLRKSCANAEILSRRWKSVVTKVSDLKLMT